HGSAEQMALAELAADAAQGQHLLTGLHPGTDGGQRQCLREPHDRLEERLTLPAGDDTLRETRRETLHERSIDLEDIHREPMQVGQGGVPRTEVVDRESDTNAPNLPQARSSHSRLARCTSAVRIFVSNTTNLPPPACFARYIAVSASHSRRSAWLPCGRRAELAAIPMLAPTTTSSPPTR